MFDEHQALVEPALTPSGESLLTPASNSLMEQICRLNPEFAAHPNLTAAISKSLAEVLSGSLSESGFTLTDRHAEALRGTIGSSLDQLTNLLVSDPQRWIGAVEVLRDPRRGLGIDGDKPRQIDPSLAICWWIGRFIADHATPANARLNTKSMPLRHLLMITEASGLLPPETQEKIAQVMYVGLCLAGMRVARQSESNQISPEENRLLNSLMNPAGELTPGGFHLYMLRMPPEAATWTTSGKQTVSKLKLTS